MKKNHANCNLRTENQHVDLKSPKASTLKLFGRIKMTDKSTSKELMTTDLQNVIQTYKENKDMDDNRNNADLFTIFEGLERFHLIEEEVALEMEKNLALRESFDKKEPLLVRFGRLLIK